MTNDENNRQPSLDDLDKKIQRGRASAGLIPRESQQSANRAMGEGFRVSIELVVSVGVGVGLGYWIGKWAGHHTIGMVLGLFVGFAAGMRTVYRYMMENAAAMETAEAEKKDTTEDGRDDD